MGFLRHQIRIENSLRSVLVYYKEHFDKLSKQPKLNRGDTDFFSMVSNPDDIKKLAAHFKRDFKDIVMKKVFQTDLEKVSPEEKACFNRAYSLPNNIERREDIFKKLALIVSKEEKLRLEKDEKLKRSLTEKKIENGFKGMTVRKENGQIDLVKTFIKCLEPKKDDNKSGNGGRRGPKGFSFKAG